MAHRVYATAELVHTGISALSARFVLAPRDRNFGVKRAGVLDMIRISDMSCDLRGDHVSIVRAHAVLCHRVM